MRTTTIIVQRPTRKVHTYAKHIRLTDVMPAIATISELHHLPGSMVDLRSDSAVVLKPDEFLVVGVQLRYGYGLSLHAWDGRFTYEFSADADLKSAMKWWASRGVDRKFDAKKSKAGHPRRGCVLKEDLRGAGQYAGFARVIQAVQHGMRLETIHRSWFAVGRLPGFKRRIEGIRTDRENRAEYEARAAKLAALQAAKAEEAEFAAAMAVDGGVIEQLTF